MSLFEDYSFWVAARVPRRSEITATIRENGGRLTAVESKAQYKIFDHARQDIPLGENHYSWKLVMEAAETGIFDDDMIEKHRIAPAKKKKTRGPAQVPRTASHGARGTRSQFSQEDDAMLAAHVYDKAYQSGNKLYQDFAEMYPHHTWHSWRDRWVKHLSRFDDSRLRYLILTAPEPSEALPQDGNAQDHQTSGSKDPRPPMHQAGKYRPNGTEQSPASERLPRPSQVKKPFTPEDDKALESFVRLKVESGESWKAPRIYKEFAKDHPHHAWESWCNRFRDLWRAEKITMKDWNVAPRGSASMSSRQASSLPSVRDAMPQPQVKRTVEVADKPAAEPRVNGHKTKQTSEKPKEDAQNNAKDVQQQDERVRKQVAEEQEQEFEQESEQESEQEQERRSQEPTENGDRTDEDGVIQPATPGMEPLPDDATEEQKFYRDMRFWLYREETENGNRMMVRKSNITHGQEFELWGLHEAAVAQTSHGIPFEDIHWGLVSEVLGLDSAAFYPRLGEDLAECWKQILDPFLAFREEFYQDIADAGGGDDEDEEGEEEPVDAQSEVQSAIDEEEQVVREGGDRNNEALAETLVTSRASPELGEDVDPEPNLPLQASPTLSDVGVRSRRKRRRRSPESEIPSTPDRFAHGSGTPANKPEPPAKKRRVEEPETQDFFYTQAIPDEDDDESDGFEPMPRRKPPSQPTQAAQLSRISTSTSQSTPQPIKKPQTVNSNPSHFEARAPRRKSLPFKTQDVPMREAGAPPRASNPAPPAPKPTVVQQVKPPGEREPETEPEPSSEDESVLEVELDEEDLEGMDENSKKIHREIQRYRGLGFSGELIENAIYRTSLCMGDLVLKVLVSLKKGKGVPKNVPGVWTPQDDNDLKFVDSMAPAMDRSSDKASRASAALNRLTKKHGPDGIQLRSEYLRDYEAEGGEPPPS